MNMTKLCLIILLSFILIGGCNDNNGSGNEFLISPDVPSDIEGGAPNASLLEASLLHGRSSLP